MLHPGLPWGWALPVLLGIVGLALWSLAASAPVAAAPRRFALAALPWAGPLLRRLTADPVLLSVLRLLTVFVFVATVVVGFVGTVIPRDNLATMLTWTVWWTLVVASVLVVGTGWCSVCPWNTLAAWLVRRRLWGHDETASSLELKVPRPLRSVWPALAMFTGLTWLELGEGVTQSPAETSALAVLMVVLATLSLALFERGAFCRYFCPVGRTIGCYAQLAPVELRPVDQSTCDRCTTLECHHGTDEIEPCPTGLTMGRRMRNTYCLSCGACALACRSHNVSWRLRPLAHEAATSGRPHWDEAWFMIGLLALATFHGLTMLPLWDDTVRWVGREIGDSTRLLVSFSLLMGVGLVLPAALYGLAVAATRPGAMAAVPYRRRFAGLAFTALPLAFAYHVAHNLTHLVREGASFGDVLLDPLGQQPLPDPLVANLLLLRTLVPNQMLFTLQAALMLGGFWLSMEILRRRGAALGLVGWRLAPMVLFAVAVSATDTWILTHPMMMRM